MNSRNKGIGFERAMARYLRKWWPEARRGLQYQDGDYSPDIINTPFYIECKRAHDKYITVNYGKGKQIRYDLDIDEKLTKVLLYYHDRMKKWNHGNMPILLIWKYDRKPIYCACYFTNKINYKLSNQICFSEFTLKEFLKEFYIFTGENNVKEKEESKAEATEKM